MMTTVRKTLSELKPLSKEREAELEALKDEDIDYSEIPRLNESFWDNAVPHQPKNKKRISIRIDNEILEFFKENGKGYQTHMNAVLGSYMQSVKNGSLKNKAKAKPSTKKSA